jgi:hypothetical protein
MNIVRKLVQVPYTFLLLNWAVVTGLYCYTRGHHGFWDLVQGPKVGTPELRLP